MIPLLYSRGSLTAKIGSLGLLYPLIHLKSSISLLAGVVGLLIVSYYRINRKLWIGILILGIAGSCWFGLTKDHMPIDRFKHWQHVLRDGSTHPIVGWGLDSYRNVTEEKKSIYYSSYTDYGEIRYMEVWDNPHNLLVSLFFEFGIGGIVLLLLYYIDINKKFRRGVKYNNRLGLYSFSIVLLVLSLFHFPMYLARFTCFIIPAFALLETELT